MIELIVHGIPVPQGSKVRTRWGLREDNPNTKPWRATVAAEAAAISVGKPLLTGPLHLEAVFTFPRPKGHFGTGRNAGVLKPSAKTYVEVTPDLDKLLRAVGDALSGVAIRDDAQIVSVSARKVYGEPACARIQVWELGRETRHESEAA